MSTIDGNIVVKYSVVVFYMQEILQFFSFGHHFMYNWTYIYIVDVFVKILGFKKKMWLTYNFSGDFHM